MEPAGCLDMVTDMFLNNKHVISIDAICLDDDASTRALVRWSIDDFMRNNETTDRPTMLISKGPNKGKLQPRPDKGKLPGHIPEPKWLANPNHRRKVLTGELIALCNSIVTDKHMMTQMDAMWLGKIYGYMIRSLKEMMTEAIATCRQGSVGTSLRQS